MPEGGEVIQKGGLLHGVPLNHAVHKPQCPQHDIALQPKAHVAGHHDMAALLMQSSMPPSDKSSRDSEDNDDGTRSNLTRARKTAEPCSTVEGLTACSFYTGIQHIRSVFLVASSLSASQARLDSRPAMQKQGVSEYRLIYWLCMLSWGMHSQVSLHCKQSVNHCDLLHTEEGAALTAAKTFPACNGCRVTDRLHAVHRNYTLPMNMPTEQFPCSYLTGFL